MHHLPTPLLAATLLASVAALFFGFAIVITIGG